MTQTTNNPTTEQTYERLDHQTNQREPISEAEMRRKLSGYYRNVDELVAMIDEGSDIPTPYATYRKA